MIILWQFSTTVMLLKKRDHPKACLFYDGQNTVKTADKSQSNKFLDFQKLQAYQKIELIRQSYDARLVRLTMFLHLRGIFLLFSSFMLWSSVFAVDYCDKHDCSPKTFVRKMSWKKDENGVAMAEPKIQEEQLLENKCWKYTWMGPENENTNKSQPCPQGPDYEDQACFPPLVWTTGPNKHNQPNTTELLEKCSAGQTEENTVSNEYFEQFMWTKVMSF